MNRILRGETLPVFGNGEQTRAFSYIADVTPIIARSVDHLEAYQQIFNIGADKPCSVNQLIEVISKVMGASPQVEYLPSRKEAVHAYSSHVKVKQYFGDLIQNVPLEAGICRMAEWVRKHGGRESRGFSHIEVGKGLPPSWA
jgi:UDP-glucose 4-epimerase